MKTEVLAGPERYRRWGEEAKACIVGETLVPGARVADVARRHGVSRSLIYAWRRARGHGLGRGAAGCDFVPMVVTNAEERRSVVKSEAVCPGGSIEIALTPTG